MDSGQTGCHGHAARPRVEMGLKHETELVLTLYHSRWVDTVLVTIQRY